MIVDQNAYEWKCVLLSDDAVDALRSAFFQELVSFMQRVPSEIPQAISLHRSSATWRESPTTPPTSPKTCGFYLKGIDVRRHAEAVAKDESPRLESQKPVVVRSGTFHVSPGCSSDTRAMTTNCKEWIIQRCTQRGRQAECVGGFELIYEVFDAKPVTEERMQAKLKSLSNADEEFRGHNVAKCRCPEHKRFTRARKLA